MKHVISLFLIVIPFSVFAQLHDSFYVNENGDHFMLGIIQLRVNDEYRNDCVANGIEVLKLKEAFSDLGYSSVKKMFPHIEPPAQEYNERGQKLADISLIYELRVPETTDILAASEKLSAMQELEYAEAKYVSHDMYTPNDAGLAGQNPYHFNTVAVYDAWDVTQGDTNVVIGITDTSFDVNHEDLSGNIKYNYDDPVGNSVDDDSDNYTDNFAGWDMVDNDNDLFIWNEIHGTAVAAIASASADNGIGYAGIGFKCKFLPVKVANNSQVVTKGYEGITYCVEQGCSVINCSWGNTSFSQTAQNVITWAAINNDVVIVAASGNVTSTLHYYPASYAHVLSVTGVSANDVFNDGVNAPFVSNDSVDVSAPGYNVYTTATFNGSALYSPPQGGTSMASPIVAGVAGLVRSQFPCLTASEVIEKIKSTSEAIDGITENIPYAGTLGEGRVNAHSAVLGNPCDSIGVSIADPKKVEVSIYPNPTRNHFVVRTSVSDDWNLQLFDATGKLVLKQSFSGERTTVSGLNAGFYIARISNHQMLFSKKLTVTN